MGSKAQRQNQHIKRIEKKIKKKEKRGLPTDKLEQELEYLLGGAERPPFKTGRDADPRLKKPNW